MARSPAGLVDLARVDPSATIAEAQRLLSGSLDTRDQVMAWRAVGMARRVKGDAAGSVEAFRTALVTARAGGLVEDAAANAISLAGSLGFTGAWAKALEVLDSVDTTPETVGRIHFQRASILVQSGRLTEAHAEFDRAIPHLESNHDMQALGLVHNNLGLVALLDGEAANARNHFDQALLAFTELDDRLQIAATGHNLGQACAAAGELVDALDWFNRTLPTIEEIAGPSFEPGRCNALLAAGLFEEAHAEAIRLARRLGEVGMTGEVPEAWLLGAEASILLNDRDGAASEARRAAELFDQQGRTSWEATARLLELEASESFDGTLPAAVDRLLDTLDAAGMSVAAGRARAAVARSLARQGKVQAAREALLQARSSVGSAPLALEVDLRLTTVEVLRAAGEESDAARVAAAGMRMLDAQQRAVAATDVRAGLGRHAARLASQGLDLAVASGRPRRVWRWMERSRATALAYQPVNPPGHDEISELLPRLRALTAAAMRPDSETSDSTRRELQRLETRIADLTRAASGGAERDSAATVIERVIDRLDGRCMIEMAIVGSDMWAVTVHAGRARLVDLGPAAEWITEARLLSSAMRRALTRPTDPTTRLERHAEATARLLAPVVPEGASTMIIAPPPELSAVPWSSVTPAPCTVVPSAATWLRAVEQPRRTSTVVAVSGPDLAHARIEADAVARTHRSASASHLVSASAMLDLLGTADVAHLACHGTLRTTQPLFTSLRMADGEVYLHELERLPHLPSLIVLSSCESGSSGGSGSEMLGMASVLLAAGVRTVIASPWPIPDTEDTVAAMVDLHRQLASGVDPATAIHSWGRAFPGSAYLAFGA